MLKYLYSAYGGTIIAPMTLINRQYYDEIIGKLITDGIDIKHFILYAEKEIIEKRLNKRLECGNSWAKMRIEHCIYTFNNDIIEEKAIII